MSFVRSLALAGVLGLAAHTAYAQEGPRFGNPAGLPTPNGYSHVVEVPSGSRLVFVSGQVALDEAGNLVGGDDFEAQVTRVFENLEIALSDAGATFGDVVMLSFYVLDTEELPALREVRDRFIDMDHPPASKVLEVSGFFRDDLLVEVEAIAVVPDR